MQFNDKFLKTLPLPAKGNRIWYDDQVTGLGLRITAAGAKSFVFNYRIHGRERRYTLGPYGKDLWTLLRARRRAGELRRMVERGEDPLGERIDARNAPTVADLCDRFEEEHIPRKRARTQTDYKRVIEKEIRPELGAKKVADVDFADIDALHQKITKRGAPYEANRMLRVASKMFNLAIKWKMRADNPVKGVEFNDEEKRERYLDPEKELAPLAKALDEHPDKQAVAIIRLLLLLGSRRGEVQAMRWDQLDLDNAIWTKRSAHTKQKKLHRVPLPAAAVQLLRQLRAEAEAAAKAEGEEVSEWVFPSRRQRDRPPRRDQEGLVGDLQGRRHHPHGDGEGQGRRAAPRREARRAHPRPAAHLRVCPCQRRAVAADHRPPAGPHAAVDDGALRAPVRRSVAQGDGAGKRGDHRPPGFSRPEAAAGCAQVSDCSADLDQRGEQMTKGALDERDPWLLIRKYYCEFPTPSARKRNEPNRRYRISAVTRSVRHAALRTIFEILGAKSLRQRLIATRIVVDAISDYHKDWLWLQSRKVRAPLVQGHCATCRGAR